MALMNSHNHSPQYIYGQIGSKKVSGYLQTKQINQGAIGTNTVALRNHDRLINLDFEHSGHTGFAGILFGTTAE